MIENQTIDRTILATVTGGAERRALTTPTDFRPCETSPRYDEWLRLHARAPGK